MPATVYLGRDNAVTLNLKQDGAAPAENTITKAALWIPGEAFSDDTPQVFDTDGSELTLTNNATSVRLDLGSIALSPGTYWAFLTIYDAVHTNGIAWDAVEITVRDWPAS